MAVFVLNGVRARAIATSKLTKELDRAGIKLIVRDGIKLIVRDGDGDRSEVRCGTSIGTTRAELISPQLIANSDLAQLRTRITAIGHY